MLILVKVKTVARVVGRKPGHRDHDGRGMFFLVSLVHLRRGHLLFGSVHVQIWRPLPTKRT